MSKDPFLEALNKVQINRTNKNPQEDNKMNIEQTLAERNATHGDFREVAKISQHLKKVILEFGDCLSPQHKEALEMMMVKVARILNGDPLEKDHWVDIQGYSMLGGLHCDDAKLDDLRQDNAV